MPPQHDLFGRPLPQSSSTTVTQPGFRPPGGNPHDEAKMTAFRKLKPICVQLMGIATQTPTPISPHAALIDSIRKIAESLPNDAFVPSLLNYILFPLTSTLRQASSPGSLPESFLEAAFRLLTLVVQHWRAAPGGLDIGVWEQLWRFTVAAVGPRVGGKGKSREGGQEMLFDALVLLSALLEPRSDELTPHPTPAMRKMVMNAKSPLMPTLFQTITLSVDCTSPHPPHPKLQRTATHLLGTLITYISGQSEILASVLPGVVSALTRSITGAGQHLKGDIAAEMSGVIVQVVTETLDDGTLRRLGVLKPVINDLSGLADEWESSPSDSQSQPAPPQARPDNPFPPLSKTYLEFTSQQLQTTIPPVLLILAGHNSDLARIAGAEMAYALIQQCHDSLPRLTPPALSTLLVLSRDDFEPVRDVAIHKLHQLLANKTLPNLDTALVDLLSSGINSLPRLIRSEQDRKVDDAAKLVSAIAKITLATSHGSRPNAIAYLLGPGGNVARWAWSLLDCLEFGRPRGWSSTANMAARTAELGWSGHLVTSSLPLLIESGDETTRPYDVKFPHLPLRHVETEHTARALGDMLEALGAAGGEAGLFSVDYFIRFAKAHRARETTKAVSAVWVAQRLLQGVASVKDEEQATKPVRKMAREVARALVAMNEDDDDDVEWDEPEEEPSDALLPVERTKGLDQLTTLLDTTPRNHKTAAAETRRLHARAQRVLLSALSLSTLATCAHILGTGFRPLLLHALYEVLAYLSSPHDLLRQYAEAALVRIAYDTGYASARNLVLDNVDYVVNVVSQRLTYHRLSPHAPLVLIAMIRLVGSDIVPMVHDVVDEIFDALDDFHGYSALASALLAVLTTLIEVMADESAVTGPTPERAAAREEAKRFLAPPDPSADFAKFTMWYNERSVMAQAEVENILERGPQKPPGVLGDGDDEEMDEDPPKDEEPIPPTRSQEVATQILEKATFYLSHASPFLRARVLGIIARSIPILAQSGREGDLLPLIDKAWPTILTRLDDPMPYVAVEAAEVIASLAEYVGDFISRRIADAWPRLLKMLNAQTELDRNSALARRGAPGTTSEYTISHRLHVALLRTGRFIVAEVPVGEETLWGILLAFRPLLDRRAHEEIQKDARELYMALGRRDGDALWVGLGATTGMLRDDKVWGYLREKGLEIDENVELVLAGI